jgi:general secretion pathway protein G
MKVEKEKREKALSDLGRKERRKPGAEGERERGFALLNVLIAVLIMGTIAAVAVPRFNAAISAANTTKIQSDLAAIDTSIALYRIDKGTVPTKMSDLANYLENYNKIEPPTGKCNINGVISDVPTGGYTISAGADGMQAHLGNYTVYDFGGRSNTQAGGQEGGQTP